MMSSGSTRRRRTIVALGCGWTILSTGCAESGGGPSTETRAAAAQFTIPGYVLTDTIIWENPGARVVLNFEPATAAPSDPCSDLLLAVENLPAWRIAPSEGVAQSGQCGYDGYTDDRFVTSGISRGSGRLVVFIAFWD